MSTPRPAGAFAPLRQPLFALIWAATVLGNTGTFMRDVASAWLMTGLSPSPTAVALVQTAAALPVFLLAIPAGVLSDILDRRRFLVVAQLWLAAVSAGLLFCAANGWLTVELLIAFTFAGGIGAALAAPSWQAIVPELVTRDDLRSAVALNSLGVNIARAIGPAAGGLMLAHYGAGLVYGLDVASYAVVIAALLWWRRPRRDGADLTERFVGAFRAGLRYARHSRELHVVLWRAAVFFAFGSAVWALLPVVAKQMLRGDAGFYGVLLGAVGVGAIAGAVLLPRLRGRLDADGLMLGASLLAAAVLGGLAFAPPSWLALALLFGAGIAWIIALTTLASVAQAVLPNWVRGRGLAIYLTVFNGAMAAGSLAWGLVAQRCGLPATLAAAAAGLAVAALALHRLKLPAGAADLEPSHHWPDPLVAAPVSHDRGPVMISVEYRVAPEQHAEFLAALRRLAVVRRRDGAYQWGVMEDVADPQRLVEWFLVESWAEHLRQHRRTSSADADLQAELQHYHLGPEPPVVRHLLSP